MASELAATPTPATRSSPRDKLWFYGAITATIGILTLSLNGGSLWIDEGFSAWVARHATVSDVTRTLAIGDVRDMQMPLHYYWLWAWTHAFGFSEYSLRAANLPAGIMFVVSIAVTSRLVFRSRFAWIPVALSPFVWFYMNEARPYLMLTSFATVAVGSLLVYGWGPPAFRVSAAWAASLSSVCAVLTHMLALFLLPALAVLLFAAPVQGKTLRRTWSAPALIFGLPLIAIVTFYSSTLGHLRGYLYAAPCSLCPAAALYEHLGFLGLGPPRNVLRLATVDAFTPYLPWLVPAAVAMAVFVYDACRRPTAPFIRPLMMGWLISYSLAILATLVVHSRFLGRHVAALLPLLLFAAIAGTRTRRQVLILAAVFGISNVRLAANSEYRKDDYRAAAREVSTLAQSESAIIAWAADPFTARYYGIAFDALNNPSEHEIDAVETVPADWPVHATAVRALNLQRPSIERVLNRAKVLRRPVYLVLSKPDLYDKHAGWTWASSRYKTKIVAVFEAFTILRIDPQSCTPT